MANWTEPTEKELGEWEAWVYSRPDKVRVVAEKFHPWKLYKMRSSGHRVMVSSFYEDEDNNIMLTVDVTGDFNFVAFERRVFGVDPSDLEECDLPGPDEITGSADMTPREVEDLYFEIRSKESKLN